MSRSCASCTLLLSLLYLVFFPLLRPPPRSLLSPTRRSSDLVPPALIWPPSSPKHCTARIRASVVRDRTTLSGVCPSGYGWPHHLLVWSMFWAKSRRCAKPCSLPWGPTAAAHCPNLPQNLFVDYAITSAPGPSPKGQKWCCGLTRSPIIYPRRSPWMPSPCLRQPAAKSRLPSPASAVA